VSDLAITSRAIKESVKARAKWRKPSKGIFKINVDAGFKHVTGDGTTRVVIRDHMGTLIRGQAIWYKHDASVLIMEALAVRDGVKLASWFHTR
jgi:hypothetical protein